jgi:hypothetical protein
MTFGDKGPAWHDVCFEGQPQAEAASIRHISRIIESLGPAFRLAATALLSLPTAKKTASAKFFQRIVAGGCVCLHRQLVFAPLKPR